MAFVDPNAGHPKSLFGIHTAGPFVIVTGRGNPLPAKAGTPPLQGILAGNGARIMEQASLSRKTETPQDCAGKLSEKWLTFRLNGQLYGLSIAVAEQIVRMQPITAVPRFPSCARGVINLRGNIVPLVDLRRVLRLPEGVETERTCIIIVSVGACQVGFMVDDVDAVLDIPPEAVSALPGAEQGAGSSACLTGIGRLPAGDGSETVVLCLNPAKLLGQDEIQLLMSA